MRLAIQFVYFDSSSSYSDYEAIITAKNMVPDMITSKNKVLSNKLLKSIRLIKVAIP